jgi:hypothetical protein
VPPPPPSAVPLPRSAGEEKQNRSRGASMRPSFATTTPPTKIFRTRLRQSTRMIPKSGHRFSDKIMRRAKGGEAPKGACRPLSAPAQTSVRSLRHSSASAAAIPAGTARLPALHRGARQAGRNQHWLSPRTGFPAADKGKVFCPPSPFAAVKRAPRGPVLVPVDRGPRAAGGGSHKSARGHRSRSAFREMVELVSEIGTVVNGRVTAPVVLR